MSGEGKLTVFNPLKDGTSRSPSWWPNPARYKEERRILHGFNRGKTSQPAPHWQTRVYTPDPQIPILLQQNLTAQNLSSIQNTFFSFREGEAGCALK